MKKALKIIGIIILIIIILVAGLLILMSLIPAVPKSYTKSVETGGSIERRLSEKIPKYLIIGFIKTKE